MTGALGADGYVVDFGLIKQARSCLSLHSAGSVPRTSDRTILTVGDAQDM